VIKSGSVLVINCGSSSIKFSVIDHETSTHVIRGIGENASPVRAMVVEQLALFGFELEPERNAMHGARSNGRVTQDGDRIAMVVPTDEEPMIARETLAVLS
jgi:acetate kinase